MGKIGIHGSSRGRCQAPGTPWAEARGWRSMENVGEMVSPFFWLEQRSGENSAHQQAPSLSPASGPPREWTTRFWKCDREEDFMQPIGAGREAQAKDLV